VTATRKCAAASRLQVVREEADAAQSRAWLRDHTRDPCRPGEWDPHTLVSSGDEDNPQTFVKRCPKRLCCAHPAEELPSRLAHIIARARKHDQVVL
jgi:hypothetical protein